MSFAAGVYSLYQPGNPVTTNTTISSTTMNNTLNDIATALSTCLLKDGTQTVTQNIPMSSFKFTGLAAGTTSGNSVRYEQVMLLSVLSAIGDTPYASAANVISRMPATASVAANATTSDLWTASETILTGGAVTFTDIVDADWAGQVAWVYMNAAHIWTQGAVFAVQGAATYTTAIGDWVRVRATTVSTFDVTIFPLNGGVVGIKGRVPITLTASQATTSGTAFAFNSIPAGVKRITIMFDGVSLSGTDDLLVQLGDAGDIEATNYVSGSASVAAASQATASSTAGFVINTPSATDAFSGHMVLTLQDAATFRWISSHVGKISADGNLFGGGDKSLSAELTRVNITRTGTDTFDLGLITVSYE